MEWNETGYTLLSSLILIIGVALCEPFPLTHEVFAASPSFAYQEIKNELFNWIDMHKHTHTPFGDPSTDIVAVNYFSDGKTLDATLWLSAPFNKTVSKDRGQVNYGMMIDADANNSTGVGGIDYQIEISGQNGKWSRTLYQWSSFGHNVTLNKIDNYTSFFGKNGYYVQLSADLNAMGSPDRYRVMFYAETLNGADWLTDFTNWIYIPKPEFGISLSPNPIDIGQGSSKPIEVLIKSSTGFEPTVHLYAADQKSKIKLQFEPSDLAIPSFGMNSSHLTVDVPSNVDIGSNTIDILASATFPPQQMNIPFAKSSNNMQSLISTGYILKLPSYVKSESVTNQSSLTVNVQTPWEQWLEVINKWQFPITFISGIVTGSVAPWLLKKIKERNKNIKGVDRLPK